MKKISLLTLALAAMTMTLFLAPQTSAAEEEDLSGIQTFITTTGQLGLLNKADGKIYVYDLDTNQCVYQAQINQLGEPLTDSETSQPKRSLEATPRAKKK